MRMNRTVESVYNQIVNTLDRLQNSGYVDFYSLPNIVEKNKYTMLSWNNYQSAKETSENYFLRVEQYCKIISTNAYWALLKDHSVIRGSFEFDNNKLLRESLLWWPCPVILDEDMVNEFGLDESVEYLFQSNDTASNVRMRTPMRIDFDVNNNESDHPRAHMHMQNVNTRINTCEPICFNRFLNYVFSNYYPEWNVKFDEREFLSFTYDNKNDNVKYNRTLKISF